MKLHFTKRMPAAAGNTIIRLTTCYTSTLGERIICLELETTNVHRYVSMEACIHTHNASQVLTGNRDNWQACANFIHYRLTREHGKLFALISDIDLCPTGGKLEWAYTATRDSDRRFFLSPPSYVVLLIEDRKIQG